MLIVNFTINIQNLSMKNFIHFIFIFTLLFSQSCFAEITGKINDRIDNKLIKDFFDSYTYIVNNQNDERVIEIYNDNELLGYIFSTWDMVKSLGYDRSPYEIIVGLNISGTIAGARLTYHNEPLFEHDISESDLLEYIERTKSINIANGMSRASRDKPIRPDTVHRGTISSNLMHEAIFKSARNASLLVGLFQSKYSNKIDYLKTKEMGWDELIKNKYVIFKNSFSFDENIDSQLAITYLNPRAIGYNILKKHTHDKLMASLSAKDNIILIAGNGYSYKGDKWRNTKLFNRIRLIQDQNIISFKASDHTRVSKIQAKDSPKFKEISIFKINSEYNFDPTKSWYIEIINENETANLKSLIIPYVLNKELIIESNKPLPMWVNIWLDSKFRILILITALLILCLITIFQEKISKYRNIFRYIRISYLSFTLIWIGWYAGAQLSIFNILSIVRIPITGADLSYFLIDPLIFIILVFTILSTLILGRGLFCGWLCPFGALQELIGFIAKYFGIKKKELPEKYYEKLWTIKYFILVTIIGVSFFSMETASNIAEIEPFKTSIMRHFNRGLPYVSYAVILLIISMFMERGFCRFICPLGGSLAVLGRIRITDKLKRRQECGNPCNLCSTSCPVKAIPSSGKRKGEIIMSECFRCLDCQLEYTDDKRCPPLVQIRKNQVI